MTARRIAIVGAGPMGLEAALHGRRAGHEVVVFESASIGEHFRLYGPVPLFTPFHMNSTELGRERLRASGVYGAANNTGPGGLPAFGEEALGERLEQRLPAISGAARSRYAGARILLLGDGRSAANAIVDLDALVRAGGSAARTRVEWVHRDRGDGILAPAPPVELES